MADSPFCCVLPPRITARLSHRAGQGRGGLEPSQEHARQSSVVGTRRFSRAGSRPGRMTRRGVVRARLFSLHQGHDGCRLPEPSDAIRSERTSTRDRRPRGHASGSFASSVPRWDYDRYRLAMAKLQFIASSMRNAWR